MAQISLSQARADLVRQRILDGAAALLKSGGPLTFAGVAAVSEVGERTIYRHFPTREALLAGLFAWSNQRIGFDGAPPTDAECFNALVERAFPGFEAIEPVIRELLSAPEGRSARLSDLKRRRAAAIALVRHEAPGLNKMETRQVAAVVQLLATASAWSTLRDYWEMDGEEAASAVTTAVRLILDGARSQRKRATPK
jgi:AcrR family transcriptional regulator